MSQDTRSQGVNDEAHADGIGRPMTHEFSMRGNGVALSSRNGGAAAS
jgi:hypothetical protein